MQDFGRCACRRSLRLRILEFQTWAQARNELMMEFFYRDMRRETGLSMSVDVKPEGGQWNLDKMNRAPPKRGLNYPEAMHFAPDESLLPMRNPRWRSSTANSTPHSQSPVGSSRLPKPFPVMVAQSCGASATASSIRDDAQ